MCSSLAKRLCASGPIGGPNQVGTLLGLARPAGCAVEDSRPATGWSSCGWLPLPRRPPCGACTPAISTSQRCRRRPCHTCPCSSPNSRLTLLPMPLLHLPPFALHPPRVLHRICGRRQTAGAGQGADQGMGIGGGAGWAARDGWAARVCCAAHAAQAPGRTRLTTCLSSCERGCSAACPAQRLTPVSSLRLCHAQVELPRVKTIVYWGQPSNGLATSALEVGHPTNAWYPGCWCAAPPVPRRLQHDGAPPRPLGPDAAQSDSHSTLCRFCCPSRPSASWAASAASTLLKILRPWGGSTPRRRVS